MRTNYKTTVSILLITLFTAASAFAQKVPNTFYDGDESDKVFTGENNVEQAHKLQQRKQDTLSTQDAYISGWIDALSNNAAVIDKTSLIVAEEGKATKVQQTILDGYVTEAQSQNTVLQTRLWEAAMTAIVNGRIDRANQYGFALDRAKKMGDALDNYEQAMEDGSVKKLKSIYLTNHVLEITKTLSNS